MLTFLSPAWVAALDAAVSDDATLARLTEDLSLVVQQEVTGGPDGDVHYHLAFDHGSVRVVPGPAASATIRFSQDHQTAASIATGRGSAQRAFMTGRLRVGGDLQVLLEHRELLAQVDDVFAPVRARTVLPPPEAD